MKLHDILEDKLVQLNTVKGELAQISAWSKRRMAKLRWQHAIATVTTLRAMGHQDIPKPDPFALSEGLSRNTSNLLSQVQLPSSLLQIRLFCLLTHTCCPCLLSLDLNQKYRTHVRMLSMQMLEVTSAF